MEPAQPLTGRDEAPPPGAAVLSNTAIPRFGYQQPVEIEVDMDPDEAANRAATPTHDGDTINSTRSLYASDIVYDVENGRTYCGEYYMPIDEAETDRLQLVHQVYLRVSNGALTTVPLFNPTKILDIGTGKGDWAMAIADQYPDAEVIGTDIAKVQPTAVPPNVFFEIDDAEDESGWTFAEDDFDLIHFRNLSGAFTDWDHIYHEAWTHLKPGGWLEVLDFDEHKGLLSCFEPDSEVARFLRTIGEASIRSGRPRTVRHLDPDKFRDLGFEEIVTAEHEIPFGQWHEDKEKKFLGRLWLTICLVSMEALSMRLLTREMGWEPEEVRRMCNLVETEVIECVKDKKRIYGCLVKMKIVRARKPVGPSSPSDDGPEALMVDENEDA
ncbi:methyltransferase domain-containing protein [Phlyctema vagabunda]|uniref:Methyltransferase domain-containing protein n=1 Tax=Phlyctema vagabunda TaxID=108571 RepID=A0ABR4PQL5_9HELO